VWRLSNSVTHPVRWRRSVYPAACAAAAVACLALGLLVPVLRTPVLVLAGALAASGALAALHTWLRPHFLGSSLVSHAPVAARLDAAISPADWQRVRDAGIPIVATLSQFRPYTEHGIPWGGWVPRYVRLDEMAREEMIDSLMAGSALPGFSDVSSLDGRPHLDGAWTDNVPAAPLLFERALDLDLLLVVYLKNVVRHGHRPNSLLGVASLLLREATSGAVPGDEGLIPWARLRWAAAGRGATSGDDAWLPRIAPIVPSRRTGNFFSGTVWFSPARARRLIELGRQDTLRVLEDLGLRAPCEPVTLQRTPGTRLGRLAAEVEQATS
jgi:hypothetical protein